jgi:hypothetical protein
MATVPLSLAPVPAPNHLAINLPFSFGSRVTSVAAAADARASAVVRAVAAATVLASPEVALRVVRIARAEPDKAVPPGKAVKPDFDDLNELIKVVDAAYGDTSKAAVVSADVKAHAAAVAADPTLVAVAHNQLTAKPAPIENAAKWVASINVELLAVATRSGVRSSGLALVPSPTSDAVRLRADHDKLRADHDTLDALVKGLVKRVDVLEGGAGGYAPPKTK